MVRGRRVDASLPITKELQQQRAFRERRAAKIKLLEDENAQLRAQVEHLQRLLNARTAAPAPYYTHSVPDHTPPLTIAPLDSTTPSTSTSSSSTASTSYRGASQGLPLPDLHSQGRGADASESVATRFPPPYRFNPAHTRRPSESEGCFCACHALSLGRSSAQAASESDRVRREMVDRLERDLHAMRRGLQGALQGLSGLERSLRPDEWDAEAGPAGEGGLSLISNDEIGSTSPTARKKRCRSTAPCGAGPVSLTSTSAVQLAERDEHVGELRDGAEQRVHYEHHRAHSPAHVHHASAPTAARIIYPHIHVDPDLRSRAESPLVPREMDVGENDCCLGLIECSESVQGDAEPWEETRGGALPQGQVWRGNEAPGRGGWHGGDQGARALDTWRV